ncbi:DNA ligase-1 [Parasphingorhabdus marina DSM 22363]|uniref:DNA ligase (ATP) n=1 Tax=Parasphingorhabdus marina DSM 22363 TaxID=1123272 RepID=A0A1N6CM38_9SPHN|nr:cisplatin damage response ATP-dependent DNA ligase [Parasphingorhabdus marina]SIN59592.1 DNA ligase-1 [Parasphingorhabdus marina DSM 22363]
MQRFAALIDRLIYTRSRNAKLHALATYLRETPDPDRGWALAALTDSLDFPAVKSSTIRNLAGTRIDPDLFRLSRHHVGDTAETVALIWPGSEGVEPEDQRLSTVVDALAATTRTTAPDAVADLLHRMDVDSRYAMLKLALGGMRIGLSARLAKTAFAQAFDVSVDAVEEYWHALEPPYTELFAWAADGGPAPDLSAIPFFRPFMLSHPFEGESLDLTEYAAEWKWDGIRVQIARIAGETRLYSRGGDEISKAFPDVVAAFDVDGVVDGELMVRGEAQGADVAGGGAASFNALQKRLGRKTVSKKMLQEAPAFIRLYDLLVDGGTDRRELPWDQRRGHLEDFVPRLTADRFDLSQVIDVPDFEALAELRASSRDAAIEGVMLKRRDSPYLSGRKVGHWYKWKRDPLTADCVMMYAQRGNGRRASFYSDYTFGCWSDEGQLLPVGKAYSGFTDAELKMLDRFVRQNTLNRFGPVREVAKTLVLEVAFDSIHDSKRHKSGLAMRFPRIHRIRQDKPPEEADRVATLKAMVP